MRVGALLRKVDETGGAIVISNDEERQLALKLLAFEDAIRLAKEKRMPHFLCDHIYETAQSFSRFYAVSRIADEADSAIRKSRLTLVSVVREQLNSIFEILGFDAPERM